MNDKNRSGDKSLLALMLRDSAILGSLFGMLGIPFMFAAVKLIGFAGGNMASGFLLLEIPVIMGGLITGMATGLARKQGVTGLMSVVVGAMAGALIVGVRSSTLKADVLVLGVCSGSMALLCSLAFLLVRRAMVRKASWMIGLTGALLATALIALFVFTTDRNALGTVWYTGLGLVLCSSVTAVPANRFLEFV